MVVRDSTPVTVNVRVPAGSGSTRSIVLIPFASGGATSIVCSPSAAVIVIPVIGLCRPSTGCVSVSGPAMGVVASTVIDDPTAWPNGVVHAVDAIAVERGDGPGGGDAREASVGRGEGQQRLGGRRERVDESVGRTVVAAQRERGVEVACHRQLEGAAERRLWVAAPTVGRPHPVAGEHDGDGTVGVERVESGGGYPHGLRGDRPEFGETDRARSGVGATRQRVDPGDREGDRFAGGDLDGLPRRR